MEAVNKTFERVQLSLATAATKRLGWSNHYLRLLPVAVKESVRPKNQERWNVSVVDMTCLLCGGNALGSRSATAEIELRCGTCGMYAITVGAVNTIRQSPAKAALARSEVERRHADGEVTPCVDMKFLDGAKPGV
jgi:hypothetical protein